MGPYLKYKRNRSFNRWGPRFQSRSRSYYKKFHSERLSWFVRSNPAVNYSIGFVNARNVHLNYEVKRITYRFDLPARQDLLVRNQLNLIMLHFFFFKTAWPKTDRRGGQVYAILPTTELRWAFPGQSISATMAHVEFLPTQSVRMVG